MAALPHSDCEFIDLLGIRSNHMVLQWHITELCNLKCLHCYQDTFYPDELSFDQLCQIVEQFKVLLDKRRQQSKTKKVHGLINVTGGEPFVRKDFFDLLERFAENEDYFRFGILSNGTLIDNHMASRLRDLKTAYVQISLEGTRETNDAIRGEGTFDRIIAALECLIAQGIKTVVSFTAHRGNYQEFSDVVGIACRLGVTRVWADRLIPCGTGMSLNEQVLTPEETRAFFEIMYAAYSEAQKRFCDTDIFMGRALQFLIGGGEPYRCGAGDMLVAIQADGELVPCRRMPVGVGNILDTPLVELYTNSELFIKLRHHEISLGCESCSFNRKCRGGLKCLSYAIHGDPFVADPGCWRVVGRHDPQTV